MFFKSLLLLPLIFSPLVLASPTDVSGSWSFHQEIRPFFKKEQVVQVIRNSKDESQLRDLKDQGFTCVYIQRDTYRCTRLVNQPWEVPADHHQRIAELMKNTDFEIIKTVGEPTVISSGDVATQWSMPALVYNQQGKTNSLIYWELSGGVNKLQFEINGESYWPLVTNSGTLNFVVPLTESKKNTQTQFYYQAVFSKVPASFLNHGA